MILDSSAVVAVATRESGYRALVQKLMQAPATAIGAPTLMETGLVLALRFQGNPQLMIADFMRRFRVEVLDFTAEHWPIALDAWLRFGKGRHPARLNFGDCLTYAIARAADRPLLCVGGDFPQTDLSLA